MRSHRLARIATLEAAPLLSGRSRLSRSQVSSIGLFKQVDDHQFKSIDSYLDDDCAVIVTFTSAVSSELYIAVDIPADALAKLDRYPWSPTEGNLPYLKRALRRWGLPEDLLRLRFSQDPSVKRAKVESGKASGRSSTFFEALIGWFSAERTSPEPTYSDLLEKWKHHLLRINVYGNTPDGPPEILPSNKRYISKVKNFVHYPFFCFNDPYYAAALVGELDSDLETLQSEGLESESYRNEVSDEVMVWARSLVSRNYLKERWEESNDVLKSCSYSDIKSDDDLNQVHIERSEIHDQIREQEQCCAVSIKRLESIQLEVSETSNLIRAKLKAVKHRFRHPDV